MEETEQADEATAKHAAERARRQAKHAAAGLPDMEVLFDEVMLKAEDGSTSKVATLVQFAEPLQATGAILRKFRRNSAQFGAHSLTPLPYAAGLPRADRLCDRHLHVAAALELQEAKVAERAQFASALEGARRRARRRRWARSPSTRRSEAHAARPGAHPAAAVETLTQANDALYELLMDIELSQVERYAAAIMAFEVAYDGLSKTRRPR